MLSQSFTDMHRITKNLSYLTCVFPAKVDQGHACFSSHTIKKCPLHSLFSATFFFFKFLLVIFGFKWVSTAEVLSVVPKCKKAVMYLTEIVHVLGTLLSGMI